MQQGSCQRVANQRARAPKANPAAQEEAQEEKVETNGIRMAVQSVVAEGTGLESAAPQRMSMESQLRRSRHRRAEKGSYQICQRKRVKKWKVKVVKKSLAKNTKKGPFKAKSAKKQAATLKKSTSSSEGLLKTRATFNRASLDSLMAGFQTEGRAKTALGMPLKDFSESAVSLLLSIYKVENEKVLSTTALAM